MTDERLDRFVEEVPAGSVVLRPMVREDVGPLGELAQALGRNVGADDYARLLSLEGARGYVLVRDDTIVGAATIMRYFEHAFLGPVVLREGGDGLVIALLSQLVEVMQREGVSVIETEATSVEEPILARMGFDILHRTAILERDGAAAGPLPPGASTSVPMRAEHFVDIGTLDADAVGYGRKEFIMSLMRELPEGARVLERDGDVVGYSLLRRAPHGFALGPIVTRDDDAEAAAGLLHDALRAAPAERVVVLAPEQSPLAPALARHGFRVVGVLVRMGVGKRGGEPQPAAREWVVGSRMTG